MEAMERMTAEGNSQLAPSPLHGRPRMLERAVEWAVALVGMASIALVLFILVFVAREAWPVLTGTDAEVSWASLLRVSENNEYIWQPVSEVPKFSLFPLVLGSLKVTFVAMMVAVPLSLGAAVYVSEFARPRVREVVKPVIELLSGVPSVVVGFFALVVLATVVQRLFGTEHRLNSIVAGVGLAFAICPVVFSVSEDALRAVPDSYRAAALAIGSTPSQLVLRVVIPAALPGIAAALVLGTGRAVGETMIVLLASGNAALFDANLGHSARTITATIAQELGEVVVGSGHYHVLFALGALLFIATFVINFVGERVIHGMRDRFGGRGG